MCRRRCGCVASDGVRHRRLGEDLRPVPEPYDGPENVPVAEVGPVEPRVPVFHPPEMLTQGLERDVLDLVILGGRHEDQAPGIP